MFEFLHNFSILHLFGLDVQKFLTSMTTNDIVKNAYSYNYLLSNQGRYLFDFFVFKESEESYYIEIDSGNLEWFLKKLQMHKLRSVFEIKNISEDYSLIYSKDKIISEGALYSYKDPRHDKLGYRSLATNAAGQEASGLYFEDKYDMAIPDGYLDLVYEKSIPVEYGAEELHAISYDKGCYVGQEVISRAKYQGVVRKNIYKLQAEEDLGIIEQGASVLDEKGEVVGILCSAYRNKAIAVLRHEKYELLENKVAYLDGVKVMVIRPDWVVSQ
jgi:folate-binding protein YgfZ